MSNDEALKQAVLDQLQWEPSVNAPHIGVTAKDGLVTLLGHVGSYSEKFAAERAAERVHGVKVEAAKSAIRGLRDVTGLWDHITVKPKPNTSEIRKSIMKALDRSWFDPATIEVTAIGGEVKLAGNVNSWYERDEAYMATWAASGTASVTNNITIT